MARFDLLLGERLEHLWIGFCFLISLAGLAIRAATVGFIPGGTSGRNTREQRARQLNIAGMYSITRNPLYLGNLIVLMGIAMATMVWWFVVIAGLAYWIYIERIIAAEETFLTAKFGDDYLAWAARTPAFIPNFALWKAPELPFSMRTVLRREYNGLFAITASFFILEFVMDVLIEHQSLILWFHEDWTWFAVLCAGIFVFITLRTLKKHTCLLRVPGR